MRSNILQEEHDPISDTSALHGDALVRDYNRAVLHGTHPEREDLLHPKDP